MEFNKENILNKVIAATQTTVVMDEGLRAYMLKVYNYMAVSYTHLTLPKCILPPVEKKLMEKLKMLLEIGLIKEKIEIKLF